MVTDRIVRQYISVNVTIYCTTGGMIDQNKINYCSYSYRRHLLFKALSRSITGTGRLPLIKWNPGINFSMLSNVTHFPLTAAVLLLLLLFSEWMMIEYEDISKKIQESNTISLNSLFLFTGYTNICANFEILTEAQLRGWHCVIGLAVLHVLKDRSSLLREF